MFRNRWCVKLSLVTLVTGCAHPGAKRNPAAFSNPGEEVVVEFGESSQPSFSADGQRLVYVSGQRSLHTAPQVYLLDLNTKIERRVTFQTGVVAHPRFHPNGRQIIYSSTTDEATEYPALLRDGGAPVNLPTWLREPSELYLHGLDDFGIRRLVVHAGFDGLASFIRLGRSITWTQVNAGRPQIISSNQVTHQTIALKNLGPNPTNYILANDLQTAAWISYDEGFNVSRLKVRAGGKVTEIAPERATAKSDPSFSSDSRHLLWAEFDRGADGYRLYAMNLQTRCAREVTFATPGSRRDPVLSPDQTQLVYTWVGRDRARVVRTRFTPPTCAGS